MKNRSRESQDSQLYENLHTRVERENDRDITGSVLSQFATGARNIQERCESCESTPIPVRVKTRTHNPRPAPPTPKPRSVKRTRTGYP